MYDYYAIIWFLLSCVFVRSMYFLVDKKLKKYKRYANLPRFRQMYIQKNLIKSIYLAFLTVYATFAVILQIVNTDTWDNHIIHRVAALYVSNDFVGLVCVDSLPKTTRIHHIVTTILVSAALSIDFQTSDIGKAMLVYTMASASAYIVNLHLAVRWLWPPNTLRWLRYIAGAIYVTCCCLSWIWHLVWIVSVDISLYHLCYLLTLVWIVRDDIILMQWLTRD